MKKKVNKLIKSSFVKTKNNNLDNLSFYVLERLKVNLGIASRTGKKEFINSAKNNPLFFVLIDNYLSNIKDKVDASKQYISKYKKIKSYRGMRHFLKLPCRGQRTHTNAQTIRKN